MALQNNKREHNKQANRAALIEAARQCFLDLGYEAVTVRDIIRASELAPGTFYNYFNDKEALFREILETGIREITDHIHNLRHSSANIEAFIHGSYHALFSRIAAEPCFFELILRNEHSVRSIFRETMLRIPMRTLKSDLQDAMSRGIFPDLDIELLAASFYGVAFEVGRVMITRQNIDPDTATQFATKLLHGGLQALSMASIQNRLAKRKGGDSEMAANDNIASRNETITAINAIQT